MAEHGCLLDHDPGFYVPDQWRPELTQTFFANPLPEELSSDLSPLSKGSYYHSAIIDQKDGSALYQLYIKRLRQSSYNCHFLISQVALGAYMGSDVVIFCHYNQMRT